MGNRNWEGGFGMFCSSMDKIQSPEWVLLLRPILDANDVYVDEISCSDSFETGITWMYALMTKVGHYIFHNGY